MTSYIIKAVVEFDTAVVTAFAQGCPLLGIRLRGCFRAYNFIGGFSIRLGDFLGDASVMEGIHLPVIFWIDVLRQTSFPPEHQVDAGTYLGWKFADEAVLLRVGRFKVDTGSILIGLGRFLDVVG